MAHVEKGEGYPKNEYLKNVLLQPWNIDARLIYAGYLIDHGTRKEVEQGTYIKMSIEANDPNSCYKSEARQKNGEMINCRCHKCSKLELPEGFAPTSCLDVLLSEQSSYTWHIGMPDTIQCTMLEFAKILKSGVFKQFPITKIEIHDRNLSISLKWFEARTPVQLEKSPAYVISEVFHKLATVAYETMDAAIEDLNRVCYRVARKEAHLPVPE
jgi:hypothetical protein